MGYFKTFIMGMAVAYGIYYITRKREDGTSMLDEMLANPREFMEKAKDYALEEAVNKVKEKLA